jgi:hypothetical protein
MISTCSICGRPLGQPNDILSDDCGGDCLLCMAVIVEDPDCVARIVMTYDAMTDDQKAIVDGSNLPGAPFPAGSDELTKDEFVAWYTHRHELPSDITPDEIKAWLKSRK